MNLMHRRAQSCREIDRQAILLGRDKVRSSDDRSWCSSLTVGMQCNSWHGEHVGLCNILDYNRNVVVPNSHRLVIRGRRESAVVIDECDRVDRSEMLVVLLGDLTSTHIVLEKPT